MTIKYLKISILILLSFSFTTAIMSQSSKVQVSKPANSKYLLGVHGDLFFHGFIRPSLRFGALLDAERHAFLVDAEFGLKARGRSVYNWFGIGAEYQKYVRQNTYLGLRYEFVDSDKSFEFDTYLQDNIRYRVDQTTREFRRHSFQLKFGHRYRRGRFIVDSNVGLGYGLRAISYRDEVNKMELNEEDCLSLDCRDNLEAGRGGVVVFHLGVRFGFYLNKPKRSGE